jgi:hypothetical protein
MDVLTGALQADDPKVSLQAAGLILSHGHRYNRALDDHETELRLEDGAGKGELGSSTPDSVWQSHQQGQTDSDASRLTSRDPPCAEPSGGAQFE